MNYTWETPVTNRKQSDIDGKTSIAYLHNFDLNRIEENIAYLSNALQEAGYLPMHEGERKIDWKREDVPRLANIRDIYENTKALADDFSVAPFVYELMMELGNISKISCKNLSYEEVNLLERYALLIQGLLDFVKYYNTHRDFGSERGVFTHGQLKANAFNSTHEQFKVFTHVQIQANTINFTHAQLRKMKYFIKDSITINVGDGNIAIPLDTIYDSFLSRVKIAGQIPESK